MPVYFILPSEFCCHALLFIILCHDKRLDCCVSQESINQNICLCVGGGGDKINRKSRVEKKGCKKYPKPKGESFTSDLVPERVAEMMTTLNEGVFLSRGSLAKGRCRHRNLHNYNMSGCFSHLTISGWAWESSERQQPPTVRKLTGYSIRTRGEEAFRIIESL